MWSNFESFWNLFCRCCRSKINLLPSIRTIKCLMTLAAIVPVLLLSLFPHQEPRFLIPIVLPLIYLHGMTILPEPDHSLVEAPKNNIHGDKRLKQTSYTLVKFWMFINTLLIIFYGFIHQGGVFLATTYLYRDLHVTPINVNYHIVTTYMYSLPESFLMQLPNNKLFTKGNKLYKVERRIHLYEEGSKDMEYITQKLSNILKGVNEQNIKETKVYLLIAGSLAENFEYSAMKHKINIKLEDSFFPHLSLEAFPNLSTNCIEFYKNFFNRNCNVVSINKYISDLFKAFKLNLYKISPERMNIFTRSLNKNTLT